MTDNSQKTGEGSELPENQVLPENQTVPEDQGFTDDEAPTVVTGVVNLEDLDFEYQFELSLAEAFGDDVVPQPPEQAQVEQQQAEEIEPETLRPEDLSSEKPQVSQPVTQIVMVSAPPVPVSLIIDPEEKAIPFCVNLDPAGLPQDLANLAFSADTDQNDTSIAEAALPVEESETDRATMIPVSSDLDPSRSDIPFSVSLSHSSIPAMPPPPPDEPHVQEFVIARPPSLPSPGLYSIQAPNPVPQISYVEDLDEGKTVCPPPEEYNGEEIMEKAPESSQILSDPREITQVYTQRQLLLPLFMKTEEYHQYERSVLFYKSELEEYHKDPQNHSRPKPPAQTMWRIFEKWVKERQSELGVAAEQETEEKNSDVNNPGAKSQL